MGKGAIDEKCALICTYCCILLCILSPVLVWLIWGIIITEKVSEWRDHDVCKADKFWWHQVTAFAAVGVTWILSCVMNCVDGENYNVHQNLPQTPFQWVVKVLQLVWSFAWSGYAVYLWTTLGDTYALTVDCSSFLTLTGDGDDFILLWKITAIFHFTMIALFIITLICACIVGKKAFSSSSSSSHSASMFQLTSMSHTRGGYAC